MLEDDLPVVSIPHGDQVPKGLPQCSSVISTSLLDQPDVGAHGLQHHFHQQPLRALPLLAINITRKINTFPKNVLEVLQSSITTRPNQTSSNQTEEYTSNQSEAAWYKRGLEQQQEKYMTGRRL